MGIYATVAQLRAEPEVPDAPPPSDADLEALIAQAEDLLDDWLGAWSVQTTGPSAGRKIAEGDIEAWQWEKLGRATSRLAARLHANASIGEAPEWDTVSGPDFSRSGWRGLRRRMPEVAALINATGLRNLSGRASA